jgi:hypothetical protein
VAGVEPLAGPDGVAALSTGGSRLGDDFGLYASRTLIVAGVVAWGELSLASARSGIAVSRVCRQFIRRDRAKSAPYEDVHCRVVGDAVRGGVPVDVVPCLYAQPYCG